MNNMFKTITLGTASIASIQVLSAIDINDVLQLVTQAVIAIATLIKMFKKPKTKDNG